MRALLLLLAFVVVPLTELWLIGEVASAISLGPTLLVLLADSLLGAVLVRREGARAWHELRDTVSSGRLPGDELAGGALLLFGGALLLTPGFLTDVLGLVLVFGPTRRLIAHRLAKRMVAQVVSPWTGSGLFGGGGSSGGRGRGRPQTDDGSGGQDDAAPEVEVLSVERDDEPGIGPGGDR